MLPYSELQYIIVPGKNDDSKPFLLALLLQCCVISYCQIRTLIITELAKLAFVDENC